MWRGVGRDLLVVRGGGRSEVGMLELREDLEAVATDVDRAELVAFRDRLDGLAAAIEAYANPELAMDDLILAWPRAEAWATASAAVASPTPAAA